jgi:hypothetical protein
MWSHCRIKIHKDFISNKKNSKHLDLIHVNIGDLKLMKTRSRKIIPLYIKINNCTIRFPKRVLM